MEFNWYLCCKHNFMLLQEIIRPHLPTVETSEEELKKYLDNNPEIKPISSFKEHPDYQDVPCKLFNHISRLIKHAGLDQAKVLTNSVQIEEGLPRILTDKIAKVSDILPQTLVFQVIQSLYLGMQEIMS